MKHIVLHGRARIRRIAAGVVLLAAASSSGAAWLDSAWNYRRTLTVHSDTTALSDFQVYLDTAFLGTSALVTAGKMRADLGDARFTTSDGTGTLVYWLYPDTTAPQGFWAKIPSINANGDTSLYYYYGNASTASASDIHTTFVYGEDYSYGISQSTPNPANNWSTTSAKELRGNPGGGTAIMSIGPRFTSAFVDFNYMHEGGGTTDDVLGFHKDSLTSSLTDVFLIAFNAGPEFKIYDGAAAGTIGTVHAHRVTNGAWNTVSLEAAGSSYTVRMGTLTISAQSLNRPDGTLWMRLNNSIARFDNLRMRKYAKPQPAASACGDEQPYGYDQIAVAAGGALSETSSGFQVTIPAGALPASANFRLLLPSSSDTRITAAAPSRLGQVFTMIGSAVEIQSQRADGSALGTLASPATISFSYTDANQDGIVDSPRVPETTLAAYRLNETDKRWDKIATSHIDAVANRVTAEVTSFSIFSVAAAGGMSSFFSGLSNFPNPFRAGSENTTVSYVLTQDADVTIRIYTLTGELVKKASYAAGTEGGRGGTDGRTNLVTWDGRNEVGMAVANGIYLARITATSTSGGKIRETRKIAVVK